MQRRDIYDFVVFRPSICHRNFSFGWSNSVEIQNGFQNSLSTCFLFQSMNQMNYYFLIDVCMVGYALILPFLLCYFSTRISFKISSIGDTAYRHTNWFEYFPACRKYIWLIILRSQLTVNLKGFDLIECSVQNFAKVSQSGNQSIYFCSFFKFEFFSSSKRDFHTALCCDSCQCVNLKESFW